jgi:YHS domain-containing protein
MSSDRAEPRRGYLSRVDGHQLAIAKIVSSIAVIFLIVGFVFQEETKATVARAEIGAPVATDQGVAIRGYDPVAYFTDGGPVQGSQTYSADWHGAEWWFETEENRTAFLSAPDRFAPQFGGFALEAVANGNGFAGNPEVFKILEGRLYLSRSPKSQSLWLRNPDGYIRAAEQAWAASCPVKAMEQTRGVKTEMVIPYC